MANDSIIVNKLSKVHFIQEPEALSGVIRIAEKVMEDIRLVTEAEVDKMPAQDYKAQNPESADEVSIIFGTIGKSPIITELNEKGIIDLDDIEGKREVYGFFPLLSDSKKSIVIVGSDKRGTIYGLFHISDMMGVSPLVNWSLVPPVKKEQCFTAQDSFISKEPSVTYRGFFINDEWPAFGNWCMKNFGGFNREAYEGIFEMLLRMKGNYLWPAMWSACFAEDGPGLASAELADELGIVMGLSHHEPCLRHGEEYKHLRGKDSIYGDAWDFRSNKEGITRFWRDGLKRNGHLENVITVGMRGEADSMILGKEATLKDNIDLIKDVLKTQNQLITEEVCPDLDKVPRMIALYKEVEAYYYGDEKTEGLQNNEDLENVILMLTDDNHGYVRSLPDDEMRKHKGGFGMYYHFDYHGEPISYEWINCTYLPEVWEEMCTAYEKGVRELWIVNVGDLGLQEMPLSYFLDLAYDYDKWGISAPDTTKDYLLGWMEKQFGGAFTEDDINRLTDIYNRYNRLIHNRRPEHLNDKVYHPQNYYEAAKVLAEAEAIEKVCLELEDKCPDGYRDAYIELISYNVLAGMNLVKLWIYRGFNHYFASIGAVAANKYARLIRQALIRDEELTQQLHDAAEGKWYGFGLGEHIGFKNWNSEEAAYPVIEEIVPTRGAALMAGTLGEEGATAGMDWTGKRLYIRNYLTGNALLDKQTALIFVAATGIEEVSYSIEVSSPAISVNKSEGILSTGNSIEYITVEVNKNLLEEGAENPVVTVIYDRGRIDFEVVPEVIDNGVVEEIKALKTSEQAACICVERDGLAVLDAAHYASDKSGGGKEFRVVKALGRREDAIKLYPAKDKAEENGEYAAIDYAYYISDPGEYDITFQLLPTHAYKFGKPVRLSYSVNGEAAAAIDIVTEDLINGVWNSWSQGVMTHVRLINDSITLKKGFNRISFIGTAEENVLERLILVKKGKNLLTSYLGPEESALV